MATAPKAPLTPVAPKPPAAQPAAPTPAATTAAPQPAASAQAAPSAPPAAQAAPTQAAPPGGAYEQANSVTMLMGVTGSGKSSQVAALARYVRKHFGKSLLLASFDGGGIPEDVQQLVATGLIWLWKPRTRDPYNTQKLAWDTIIKAFQGWYPLSVDPTTGVMPVGGALMPPIAVRYQMFCPNGHLVKAVTRQKDLTAMGCPACGSVVNSQNMRIVTDQIQPEFFKQIGAVAIDSISQALSWGEDDLAERSGAGDLGGMDGAIGGKIISGDQAMGQTTMSHVGFVQQQAKSLCLMAANIPNLVVPPLVTALTMVVNSKDGDRVCGPVISGKAKTDQAATWVGNCLEAEKVSMGKSKDGQPLYRHRLYLSQWTDDRGIIHLCKNRASAGALPAYLEDPVMTGDAVKDRANAFTQCSLGTFFTMLDASLKQGVAAAEAEFGVERIKPGMVTFEDPFSKLPAIEQAAKATGPAGPAVPMAPRPAMTPGTPAPQPVASAAVPAAPAPAAPKVAKPAAPAAVTITTTSNAPLPQVGPPPPPVQQAAQTAAPPTVAPPPGRPRPPQAAPKPS